jgi:hypothetical protein
MDWRNYSWNYSWINVWMGVLMNAIMKCGLLIFGALYLQTADRGKYEY